MLPGLALGLALMRVLAIQALVLKPAAQGSVSPETVSPAYAFILNHFQHILFSADPHHLELQ